MNRSDEFKDYIRLDFSKIIFSDKQVPFKEELLDIEPIHWSEEVLIGDKIVEIKQVKN